MHDPEQPPDQAARLRLQAQDAESGWRLCPPLPSPLPLVLADQTACTQAACTPAGIWLLFRLEAGWAPPTHLLTGLLSNLQTPICKHAQILPSSSWKGVLAFHAAHMASFPGAEGHAMLQKAQHAEQHVGKRQASRLQC